MKGGRKEDEGRVGREEEGGGERKGKEGDITHCNLL